MTQRHAQALPGTEDKVRERLHQVQTALEPLDQEKSKLDRGANRYTGTCSKQNLLASCEHMSRLCPMQRLGKPRKRSPVGCRVVRAILWAGLGGFIIQWALLLRLTFWELSWCAAPRNSLLLC